MRPRSHIGKNRTSLLGLGLSDGCSSRTECLVSPSSKSTSMSVASAGFFQVSSAGDSECSNEMSGFAVFGATAKPSSPRGFPGWVFTADASFETDNVEGVAVDPDGMSAAATRLAVLVSVSKAKGGAKGQTVGRTWSVYLTSGCSRRSVS